MPIQIACVGCGSQLRVRDEFLGKAIKCPHCGQVLRPELPPQEAVQVVEPMPVVQPAVDDDAEERPRSRRRRRDEDDDEPRPRRKGYVRCPGCGGRHAERVMWTFWGSFYGPALLTHVRCPDCGTAYNGRTGGSNLIWAIIFVMVPLMLIFMVLGGLAWVIIAKRNPAPEPAPPRRAALAWVIVAERNPARAEMGPTTVMTRTRSFGRHQNLG